MKLNPIARMFKGGEKPATRLMAITPPRTGERTLLGVENLLGSVAVPEPFSLEIAGDSGGVTLLARCREGSFVRQQLGVHYPQAKVNEVPAEDDPLQAEGRRAGLVHGHAGSGGRSTFPCAPSGTTTCWTRARTP